MQARCCEVRASPVAGGAAQQRVALASSVPHPSNLPATKWQIWCLTPALCHSEAKSQGADSRASLGAILPWHGTPRTPALQGCRCHSGN